MKKSIFIALSFFIYMVATTSSSDVLWAEPNEWDAVEDEAIEQGWLTGPVGGEPEPDPEPEGEPEALEPDDPGPAPDPDCVGSECPYADDEPLTCIGPDCPDETLEPDCTGPSCPYDDGTDWTCVGPTCPDALEPEAICTGPGCDDLGEAEALEPDAGEPETPGAWGFVEGEAIRQGWLTGPVPSGPPGSAGPPIGRDSQSGVRGQDVSGDAGLIDDVAAGRLDQVADQLGGAPVPDDQPHN
jgi:hypothetical protein